MKITDLLTEAKKPNPPKTRSPAAASLTDRKYQQKIVPNKKKKIDPKHKKTVGIDETRDPGEYDMEGDSVKTNLLTIMRACKQLGRSLSDNENLPEWVQDKVAQAKGMMVGVTEYMLSTGEREHDMNEAGNPAQQAAIAIAKKKSGKYNKDGKRIKETSVAEQRSLAEPRIVQVGDDTQGLNDFRVVGPNHLSIYPFPAKQWNNEQHQARAKGYQLQYVGNDPAKAKAAAWPGETPKSRPMAVKEARKSAWDKMAGAVKSSTGKDLNKGDERAQDALKGLKKSAKDYQNVVDKDKKTNEGTKQKGVDGKACWDGYKRMGTKKKGGKTVDNCVPTGK
jgi:hypothetical protein